jgi:hypothetical protein
MTSINGIELKLATRPEITTEHTQNMTPLPGNNGVHIDDMGYGGLQIRIKGYDTALDRYDAIIAAFMASGEQTLILRDDWKYKVYSNRYNMTQNNDSEEYFPYEFLLYTREPYQYSEDEKTLSKSITSNNQEWSASDGGVSILTTGTVAAKPDIQITAASTSSLSLSQTSRCDS